MVFCFLFALITGKLSTRSGSLPRFAMSLHLPLACIGYFAFFIHGSTGKIGGAYGDILILALFITSLSIFGGFSLAVRIRELEVDHSSVFGKKYLFLVLKYSDSHSIAPGATFNIYASSDLYLSLFHGSTPFQYFQQETTESSS